MIKSNEQRKQRQRDLTNIHKEGQPPNDMTYIDLDQVGRLGDLAVPHIRTIDEEESVISLKNIFLLTLTTKTIAETISLTITTTTSDMLA